MEDIARAINNSRVVIIKSPMDLYHVITRNSPLSREFIVEELGDMEKLERYKLLPEGAYPTDFSGTTYFSIQRMHPYYYSLPEGLRDVAYLHFTTVRPMVLYDGRGIKKINVLDLLNFFEQNRELCKAVDGWVIQDDYNDTWHEIVLFEPTNFINPDFEEMVYSKQEMREFNALERRARGFPYGDEDAANLRRSILGTGSLSFDGKCIIHTD